MEQNMPVIAKKVWNIMRIALVMLRKGVIPKKKLLLDLNMMMKKGKLASKLALGNLMLHLHHHHATTSGVGVSGGAATHLHHYAPGEYEFSCSSTPLYRHYFNKKSKNHKNSKNSNLIVGYEDIDNVNLDAVNKVLEMMMLSGKDDGVVAESPAGRLGFGRSPVVRQLRIMDSPYRVHNVEEDIHVDKAADEFIKRFYSELKQQQC